jgi:hypothetical protein
LDVSKRLQRFELRKTEDHSQRENYAKDPRQNKTVLFDQKGLARPYLRYSHERKEKNDRLSCQG